MLCRSKTESFLLHRHEEEDIAQARVAKRDQQEYGQRQQRERHRKQERSPVRQRITDPEAAEACEQGEILVEREDREEASLPPDQHKLEKERKAGQHCDGRVECRRALFLAPGRQLFARRFDEVVKPPFAEALETAVARDAHRGKEQDRQNRQALEEQGVEDGRGLDDPRGEDQQRHDKAKRSHRCGQGHDPGTKVGTRRARDGRSRGYEGHRFPWGKSGMSLGRSGGILL
jgi:hypothetical protein